MTPPPKITIEVSADVLALMAAQITFAAVTNMTLAEHGHLDENFPACCQTHLAAMRQLEHHLERVDQDRYHEEIEAMARSLAEATGLEVITARAEGGFPKSWPRRSGDPHVN